MGKTFGLYEIRYSNGAVGAAVSVGTGYVRIRLLKPPHRYMIVKRGDLARVFTDELTIQQLKWLKQLALVLGCRTTRCFDATN
jgi:hypothetical protein